MRLPWAAGVIAVGVIGIAGAVATGLAVGVTMAVAWAVAVDRLAGRVVVLGMPIPRVVAGIRRVGLIDMLLIVKGRVVLV
jgi:hypothetical protein